MQGRVPSSAAQETGHRLGGGRLGGGLGGRHQEGAAVDPRGFPMGIELQQKPKGGFHQQRFRMILSWILDYSFWIKLIFVDDMFVISCFFFTMFNYGFWYVLDMVNTWKKRGSMLESILDWTWKWENDGTWLVKFNNTHNRWETEDRRPKRILFDGHASLRHCRRQIGNWSALFDRFCSPAVVWLRNLNLIETNISVIGLVRKRVTKGIHSSMC